MSEAFREIESAVPILFNFNGVEIGAALTAFDF